MSMNHKLIEEINKSDMPNLLKNYLLRNKHVQLFFNLDLLNATEDLYIEYDSLYIFDEAEFCSFIMAGLKKIDKHDYFYYYMKKILDTELNITYRHEINNHQQRKEINDDFFILKEVGISRLLIRLHKEIDNFNETKELDFLTRAHHLEGMLTVLFYVYPDNEHLDEFNTTSILLNKEVRFK